MDHREELKKALKGITDLKWIFTDINEEMEDYHSEFHSRSTDIVEVMQETNNELIEEFLQ